MKQKKNIVAITLTIVMVTVFVACTKDSLIGNKIMSLTFRQTQCADPWGYGSSDSLTVVRLKNYIDTAGLAGPLLSIKLEQKEQQQVCQACTCATGKLFTVSVMESETLKQKYVQRGFVLVE